MQSELRVVTATPLEHVWGADDRDLRLERTRDLDADEVKMLLRKGLRQFVLVDVGQPLLWVEGQDVFEFWRNEVAERLAKPAAHNYLDDFPGGYCYHAEEWLGPDGHVVVVTKWH